MTRVWSFFLPFATWAGIGDGHWRALALLAFELRELDVADSGRSKDEQRCNNVKKRRMLNKKFTILWSSSAQKWKQFRVNIYQRKWKKNVQLNEVKISAIKVKWKKRNLQLAMEVYMRAKWLVIFAMCFQWCFHRDFETCRQSVRAADGLARKPLKSCVDGQRWRQLLEPPAVATLTRRVIDSLPSRPRKVRMAERKKTWFMSLRKWTKCYNLQSSNW